MSDNPKLNIVPVNWGGGKHLTVLIDSNALSLLSAKTANTQVEAFLSELTETFRRKQLKIVKVISLVSVYEVLCEGDITKYKRILESVLCYEINKEVNFVAAKIHRYLIKHGISCNDIADLYIAATAIITSSSILSANPKDFPPLMFKELGIRNITWKNRERTRNVTLYLLRPDYQKMKDKLISVI